MKQWFTIIGLILTLQGGLAMAGFNPTPQDEAYVDELLAKMTLEEKVGQMTQLTFEAIQAKTNDETAKIDPEKLRKAILEYGVGSILNNGGSANTLANWHEIITQIQDMATKESRLKIPVIYGIDSIHGANYVTDATLFPQSFAMAATRNAELVRQTARVTAIETRAAGIPWNFNPVLDLGRQPMWPRFWETYGEDPTIASVYARAYVEGLQGGDLAAPDNVAACLKHYLGYSAPLSGQDRTPAYIPERQLRQLYLKPFAAAVEAGAATVMVNSSEINGIPVHSDRYLLHDVLVEELGFKGFVVTDWADIKNLYEREKVAADEREATRMSIMAGIDMSMVPYDYTFCDTLIALVKDGEVPMARIDEAVRRILLVKKALGLFDAPYPDASLAARFATDESRALNLRAAHESITLLKNDGNVLPLATGKKYLVVGPCANRLSTLNGGWTITWQGDREELYPRDKHETILDAVRRKAGAANVEYVEGSGFEQFVNIETAVAQAVNADVIIACMGEPTYCEGVGNIPQLDLPVAQQELVHQLNATGKPVVLVLTMGRPRTIRELVDRTPAIVMGYLPGMEGGTAIADVLFGEVNPSGKLPFTWPMDAESHTTYDHKPSETYKDTQIHPQWEFGHGLSYTQFEYKNLKLDKTQLIESESLGIEVDITNTGSRAGLETADLFISDKVASVTPANEELKGFAKVELQPGETKTVSFRIDYNDLSFIGRDMKPVVEPGEFEVAVGGLRAGFVVPNR